MSTNCTHSQCRNRFECEIPAKAEMDSIQPEIEAMIDQHGLDIVLAAIREICYAKASKIAVEYQDLAQAKLWLAKGIKVNSAAQGAGR